MGQALEEQPGPLRQIANEPEAREIECSDLQERRQLLNGQWRPNLHTHSLRAVSLVGLPHGGLQEAK